MKNKSGIIATLIIYATLIVLLSVCTFAIPFPKLENGILVGAYLCSVVMIVILGGLTLSLLFKEEDGNQRVLSLPILRFGVIGLVLQLTTTVIFYICNAFVEVQPWIIVLVECLLYGYLIISMALAFFFKNRNVEYHEHIANTKFMDNFRARLKAINEINRIDSVKKELEDLLDTANASDPVTNDKTLDSESELLSDLQELDEAIKEGSVEQAKIVINKTKTTLIERNVLCKVSK